MPGAEHDVDDVRRGRGPRRTDASASAPRFASLSTSTCTPEPARRAHAGACTPAQPGRITAEPILPLRRSIGPGRRDADADDLRVVHAGLRLERVEQLDREVDRVRRGVVDVDVAPVLRENGRGEIGQSDPNLVVVEVDAGGHTGGRVEPEEHRRAARAPPAARRRRRPRRRGPAPGARRRGCRPSSARGPSAAPGRCGSRSRAGAARRRRASGCAREVTPWIRRRGGAPRRARPSRIAGALSRGWTNSERPRGELPQGARRARTV